MQAALTVPDHGESTTTGKTVNDGEILRIDVSRRPAAYRPGR